MSDMNVAGEYAGTVPLWTAGGDRLWSSPRAPALAAPLVSCRTACPEVGDGIAICQLSWLAAAIGQKGRRALDADI
eukprot:10690276-Alexandrium_andersonii.AAC.1